MSKRRVPAGAGVVFFCLCLFADEVRSTAMRFDGGNDYVLVPRSRSLNIGTNQLTLELWVKLDKLPEDELGSDLVAYWRLNEATGLTVFDLTPNDNAGLVKEATFVPSSVPKQVDRKGRR